MDTSAAVTAVVLTGNSSRLLDRCLDSVAFCDRLLVVDSYSQDRSVEIAKEHGATVLERALDSFGNQHLFALEHVTTEWVFLLDSDEICSSKLAKEIKKFLEASHYPEDHKNFVGGAYISRRSWYFDRFMEYSGWRPDYLLRLFRKGKAKMVMQGMHQSYQPLSKTVGLEGEIIHYPYTSFFNHLEKLNNYAQRGADDLRARGRRGGVLAGLGHGLGRFCKLYFLKQGFRDGRAGFINATHGAIYAYLKYLRVLQANWGAPYDHEE